jgi:hypothetical protein
MQSTPEISKGGLSWAVSLRGSLDDGSRCGACVDQLPPDGVYPKVEPFQRVRAKQHEIARLSEHDVISGSIAGDMNKRRAGPALENSSVGLAEAPLFVPLNAKGLERFCWDPRQFRTCVNEHRCDPSSLAWFGGILDLDIYAKGSHVVGHIGS